MALETDRLADCHSQLSLVFVGMAGSKGDRNEDNPQVDDHPTPGPAEQSPGPSPVQEKQQLTQR